MCLCIYDSCPVGDVRTCLTLEHIHKSPNKCPLYEPYSVEGVAIETVKKNFNVK